VAADSLAYTNFNIMPFVAKNLVLSFTKRG
jgi:hypothetical protein